ncbi:MAG: pilin [Patescibacteria group bacterium]|jgi:hypothetical protein|nr:pilin [Patescibacteria group bacterium]
MRLKSKTILAALFFGLLIVFSGTINTAFAEVKPLDLQVSIPGATGASVSNGGKTIKFDRKTTAIGEYIKNIYNYAISIVGIVATIMLLFGGFTWLTAGGSGEKVGKARDIIFGSLTGLVLALTSYTLLTMVNPDLVNFKIQKIKTPEDTSSGLGACDRCTVLGNTGTCVTRSCVIVFEKENCDGTYLGTNKSTIIANCNDGEVFYNNHEYELSGRMEADMENNTGGASGG